MSINQFTEQSIKRIGDAVRAVERAVPTLTPEFTAEGASDTMLIPVKVSGGIDGTYSGIEQWWDTTLGNWADATGGLEWDSTSDLGRLVEMNKRTGLDDSVFFASFTGDQTDSIFWTFSAGIGGDGAADETVSFKHYLDGTKIHFYDGTVLFNNRVNTVVSEPSGGFDINDGFYFVNWEMVDGTTYAHTTNAEIQYSASVPTEWDEVSDGTIIVNWKLAEVDNGIVKALWENDIIGPGSGLPSYVEMIDGTDPLTGRYAGIKDATQVSDRVDHDYFFEMVESKDKYTQGAQYSHNEGPTKKFGGITGFYSDIFVEDVDGSTEDEVTFYFGQVERDIAFGLVQDDESTAKSFSRQMKFVKWLGTDPGKNPTIKHNPPPVDSTADPDHWKSLFWDGTNWFLDGTQVSTLSIDIDINGHIWAINGSPPPPPGINYRYVACPGEEALDPIVVDSSDANVLLYDGDCYVYDGTTTDDAQTLTIDGTYADCSDCIVAATKHQWKRCDNDAVFAVLPSTLTTKDYGYIKNSSDWIECYFDAETSDAVDYDCFYEDELDSAPASCGDLTQNRHEEIQGFGDVALGGDRDADFDGSGDYIVMDDSSDWDFFTNGQDGYISFYFKATNFSATRSICEQLVDANNQWQVQVSSVSGLKIRAESGGSSQEVNSGGTTGLSAGTWHHGLISKTGTTFRVYLDGTKKGEGTITTTLALSAEFRLGGATGNWLGSLSRFEYVLGTNGGYTGSTITVPTRTSNISISSNTKFACNFVGDNGSTCFFDSALS